MSLGLNGIANAGNTCYMNTILQCLSNTPAFRQVVLSGEYVIHPESKTKGKRELMNTTIVQGSLAIGGFPLRSTLQCNLHDRHGVNVRGNEIKIEIPLLISY